MKISDQPNFYPIKNRIEEEIVAMIKYIASEGKTIPKLAEKFIVCSENENKKDSGNENKLCEQELLLLHNQLSQRILPAKPKTILLLYKDSKKDSWYKFLGPVNLVRRLMATTLICLALFIIISLSPDVTAENLSMGIFAKSPFIILQNLLFIITAAALGGCFSSLFQVNKYINNGTYDPKYESSYWIRMLLGMVAGMMLAVIIPDLANMKFSESNELHLTIPLLAMIGGFSSSLVYRILVRIVWAVESLFVGKQEDLVQQKLLNMQSSNEKDKLNIQQMLFKKLSKIKVDISSDKSKEELENSINEILKNLFHED